MVLRPYLNGSTADLLPRDRRVSPKEISGPSCCYFLENPQSRKPLALVECSYRSPPRLLERRDIRFGLSNAVHIFSKPNQDTRRLIVNLSHKADLILLLFLVMLVYADCISPDYSWRIGATKAHQSRSQVSFYTEVLSITFEVAVVLLTPSVRQRLVEGIRFQRDDFQVTIQCRRRFSAWMNDQQPDHLWMIQASILVDRLSEAHSRRHARDSLGFPLHSESEVLRCATYAA